MILPVAESACREPSAKERDSAGNAFSHKGSGGSKHSTHAEADKKTINREIRPPLCAPRETSEARIQQQRRCHGLYAAKFVAEHPKDNSAGGPAKNHPHRSGADVLFDLAECERVISQKLFKSRLPSQDEQPLIHAIKKPAAGGDDHYQPVVKRNLLGNIYRRSSRRGCAAEVARILGRGDHPSIVPDDPRGCQAASGAPANSWINVIFSISILGARRGGSVRTSVTFAILRQSTCSRNAPVWGQQCAT